uniref:Uncharacterized protein n=1 Tax=Rhizophora mucronata TaxID=61149 RepID=A0A2P2JPY4_RHIMU
MNPSLIFINLPQISLMFTASKHQNTLESTRIISSTTLQLNFQGAQF